MSSPASSTPPVVNLSVDTLGRLLDGVRLVDVREPQEFDGPLGHLPNAELIPLARLPAASESWSSETPILLVCRSGARSAQAAEILRGRGFRRLYNLRGGMLAVRAAQVNPGR